jgi:anti-sigma factor ChrR (cupin superfamily)
VVRAGADGWRAVAPGTRVRPLAGGAGESVDLALLEMAPGGLLPEHEHGGLEEIFLLRGSCRAQGRCIRAGDYHRAGHGSEHEDTTTDEGCLMLVVLRKAA